MSRTWRGRTPPFLSGPVGPKDRAPEDVGVRTTESYALGIVPGSKPWRQRVRPLKPETCTKLAIVRAPLALKSRISTWSKKFKVAPHGHNAPEVRAICAQLFTHEGVSELRARLRDLLDLCAQVYHDHSQGFGNPWPLVSLFKDGCYNEHGALISPTTVKHDDMIEVDKPVVQTSASPLLWTVPGDYQGWLLVLGVTESDGVVTIHTHLEDYQFEGTIKEFEPWLTEQGIPLHAPLLDTQQVAMLRLLLELFWFAHEELGHPEPTWSLFKDGSLDLNLYGESHDVLTRVLFEHENRMRMIARRFIEKVEAESEAAQLAQDRDYVPFWESGSQEDEPVELLFGAVALRNANAKDKVKDERLESFRIGEKDLQIVQFQYQGFKAHIEPLTWLREHKSFDKGEEGEKHTVHYWPWNTDLIQPHWLIDYYDKNGKLRHKGHPDLLRMVRGAAHFGIEQGVAPITIRTLTESPTRSVEDPETGELTVRENDFLRKRYIEWANGNVTPVGKRRRRFVDPDTKHAWMWQVCPRCRPDPAQRVAKNKKRESPFREHPHASICMFCGRTEYAQVQAYIYLPIHWFADVLKLELFVNREHEGVPFERDGYFNPATSDVFIRVPFYGKHVEHLMRRHQPVEQRLHGYWGPDDNGLEHIIEPATLHPIVEDFTYPAYTNGRLVPKTPRWREAYADGYSRLHVILDGIDWFSDAEHEDPNNALHSLHDKLHRLEMRHGTWMRPGGWNPQEHGRHYLPWSGGDRPTGRRRPSLSLSEFAYQVKALGRMIGVGPSNTLDLLLERVRR